MSTEIVRATPGHSQALSLGAMTPRDAWAFAESLARTPLLPDSYRNNPASVLWALEYGRALGLDVVTTITTIHVIKGKPTQSADLMLSRARAAGHRIRIKPERTQCVVSIVRADDPDDETVIEWTLDDAVTAGLCTIRNGRPYSRSSKGEPQAWEKYPRAMLRSRAVAEAVRTVCPEVLHGAIYTPEELGAYVDQDGNPIDAPVQPLRVVQSEPVEVVRVDVPPAADADRATVAAASLAKRAADATTLDQWRGLWAEAGAAGLMTALIVDPAGDTQVELGAYLKRRGAELNGAKPAPVPEQSSTVVDAGVLGDQDEREAALDALRGAAVAAGVADTIERDFLQSYGVDVMRAEVEQLREMTALLQGAAA